MFLGKRPSLSAVAKKREEMSFDKILNRVKKLGVEANISINITPLVAKGYRPVI